MKSASIVTIIPFFNRRHTILRALESVKSQTIQPQQLIVVDDGSTDGGPELVDQWIAQNRGQINCRSHRQAKSGAGAAAARNSGLKIADPSVFVAFHDSDDVWPTDFLQRTHDLLAVAPRAIAASCDRMFVYANGVPSILHDSSQLSVNASLWLLEHGAGLASATLFRRDAIDRLGHFPLIAAGEDAALFLPLSLEGPWLYARENPSPSIAAWPSDWAMRKISPTNLATADYPGPESTKISCSMVAAASTCTIPSIDGWSPECGTWPDANSCRIQRLAPPSAVFQNRWLGILGEESATFACCGPAYPLFFALRVPFLRRRVKIQAACSKYVVLALIALARIRSL